MSEPPKATSGEEPRPLTAAERRERRGSSRSATRPASSGQAVKTESGKSAKTGRKKRSIFGRALRYLREVVSELRKVIWPTRKQMITYTAVVLVFVAFMVALIFGLDAAFAWGMFRLFG